MTQSVVVKVGMLVLAMCFAMPSAYAEGEKKRKRARDYKVQISPFVGYRFGGSFEDDETEADYDLDNNSSVGLVVNFPAQNNTEWELYYSRQETEVKTGDLFQSTRVIDMDVQYLHIGGTYLFDRTKETQPYFVATIGAAKFEPDGPGTDSDEFFSFSIGGGYKYFPDERFGLRLDGRFLGSLIDSDSDIFCSSTPEAGGECIIQTRGDILWQFELQAGFIVRF